MAWSSICRTKDWSRSTRWPSSATARSATAASCLFVVMRVDLIDMLACDLTFVLACTVNCVLHVC